MQTKLETALACIADSLPIPIDLTADLLEQGIDVGQLTITDEEQLEFDFSDTTKDL